MNMHQSPVLAAVVAKQRQQDLRREATRAHAAKIACSAGSKRKDWPGTPRQTGVARIHFVSTHRLLDAARRVEIRLAAACTAIGTRLVS
jgi:hypothetical protein